MDQILQKEERCCCNRHINGQLVFRGFNHILEFLLDICLKHVRIILEIIMVVDNIRCLNPQIANFQASSWTKVGLQQNKTNMSLNVT